MKTIAIKVTGRVQGVWYRASTKEKATRLGLAGFVQNEPDGSVYIEVSGEGEQLDQFLTWCREGPRHAKVGDITTREIPYRAFEGFEIRR